MPPKARGLPLFSVLPTLIRHQFDVLLKARTRYSDIDTVDLSLTKLLV